MGRKAARPPDARASRRGQKHRHFDASLGVLWSMTATGALTVLHTFNLNVEGPTALGMDAGLQRQFLWYDSWSADASDDPLPSDSRRAVYHFAQFSLCAVSFQRARPRLRWSLYGTRNGATIFKVGLNGSGYTEFVLPGLSEVDQPIFRAGPDLWEPWADGSLPNGGIRQVSSAGILPQTIPFDGTDGSGPVQSLLQVSDGKILGVTFGGSSVPQGEVANGVVFTLDAGLPAPQPGLQASILPSARWVHKS